MYYENTIANTNNSDNLISYWTSAVEDPSRFTITARPRYVSNVYSSASSAPDWWDEYIKSEERYRYVTNLGVDSFDERQIITVDAATVNAGDTGDTVKEKKIDDSPELSFKEYMSAFGINADDGKEV